ncbi:hypothetical protein [Streptomyces johnsoniae]|uniref:Uncharacterized protein n=1 Tax=Streptomyces johnsoniae TaxID=3075532 RepID=A0ABU2S7K8_9ACTN|nr:hypothetical protein [Streptomyces sp. DSM 41886]MDT0444962.1 hypothetical protein [Streptomyces sp. DSM 41886]
MRSDENAGIGDRIARLRHRRKLTREQLAATTLTALGKEDAAFTALERSPHAVGQSDDRDHNAARDVSSKDAASSPPDGRRHHTPVERR